MRKHLQLNRFLLEALESRILLSADPLSGSLQAIAPESGDQPANKAIEEVLLEKEQRGSKNQIQEGDSFTAEKQGFLAKSTSDQQKILAKAYPDSPGQDLSAVGISASCLNLSGNLNIYAFQNSDPGDEELIDLGESVSELENITIELHLNEEQNLSELRYRKILALLDLEFCVLHCFYLLSYQL